MNEFDYIVVGGGTAGCVVATRLSQSSKGSVLLIEAGSRRMPFASRVPLMFHTLKQHRRADWAYMSEPEPGAGNRRFLRSHGRGLGGSSAINGMIAVRGHALDYDAWAALGLPGWSYSELLPFFRRSESNWRGESAEHGGDGPWRVGPGYRNDPLYCLLLESCRAHGRPIVEDFCGYQQDGLGAPDFSIDAGLRVSMASAYLPLAGPNLAIMTNAHATRILIDGRRAVGVEVQRGGKVQAFLARGEVVLSAGGYNSPQLLLLSGVGDAAMLREQGITPVHHLPGVGRNLQGHVSAPLRYRSRERTGFHRELRFDRLARSAVHWAATRKGVFGQVPLSALSYVRSREGLERPDIQIMYMSGRMDDRPWFPLLRPGIGHYVASSLSLARPLSRGSITLRSPSPFDPPRIRFNLLDHPDDIIRLRDAVKRERQFYATSPLANCLGEEEIPGSAFTTDAQIEGRLRQVVTSGQHPTSACAMGVGRDAVCDAALKVRGIDGLRVADASIMPLMVSANTYATVVMIGEKGADLILQKASH